MDEERQLPIRAARPVALVADIRSVNQIYGSFQAFSPSPRVGLVADVKVGDITFNVDGDSLGVFLQFQLEGSPVSEPAEEEAETDQDGKERVPCIEINARFVLTYAVPALDTQPADAIEAFSHLNTLYNVWPYWREYVQAATSRVGYPPMLLPVLRVVDGELKMGDIAPLGESDS